MWFIAAFYHRRRRDRDGRRQDRDRNSESRATFSVQITDAARGKTPTQETHKADRQLCDARPMPLLYGLAKSWAWDAVAFRCETHPGEATMNWTDNHGDNVLHWSVIGKPPLSPIQNILAASPDLAKVRNNRGLFPLHGTHIIPASIASWTNRNAEKFVLYSSNVRLLSLIQLRVPTARLPKLSKLFLEPTRKRQERHPTMDPFLYIWCVTTVVQSIRFVLLCRQKPVQRPSLRKTEHFNERLCRS
jgi:hypothetical protein